jgi:hypothetical protein
MLAPVIRRIAPLARTAAIIVAALALVSISLVPSYAATTTPTLCQSIAIPDYITPSPTWDGGASPPVNIVVANVDSGPGTTQESNYVTAIDQAQAAGITVLGYVWTDYGSEPTATVEAEVNRAYTASPASSLMALRPPPRRKATTRQSPITCTSTVAPSSCSIPGAFLPKAI